MLIYLTGPSDTLVLCKSESTIRLTSSGCKWMTTWGISSLVPWSWLQKCPPWCWWPGSPARKPSKPSESNLPLRLDQLTQFKLAQKGSNGRKCSRLLGKSESLPSLHMNAQPPPALSQRFAYPHPGLTTVTGCCGAKGQTAAPCPHTRSQVHFGAS
jgi:hypothetical protein